MAILDIVYKLQNMYWASSFFGKSHYPLSPQYLLIFVKKVPNLNYYIGMFNPLVPWGQFFEKKSEFSCNTTFETVWRLFLILVLLLGAIHSISIYTGHSLINLVCAHPWIFFISGLWGWDWNKHQTVGTCDALMRIRCYIEYIEEGHPTRFCLVKSF